MPRYIDVNALLKSAVSKFKCVPSVGVIYCGNGEEIFDGEDLQDFIRAMPTADVVEVVRCKDCLWWYDEGFDPILNRRDGKCGRPLGEYIDSVDFETSEYDFCSAAERREGCL